MQVNKKILKAFILIILFMLIISSTVSATLIDTFEGSIDTSGEGAEELKSRGGEIVGIIQIIGTISSFAMITILGIKYILGSAEEKAEYKKSMIPYLIGAVLIFGFSNITQIIYEWAKEI